MTGIPILTGYILGAILISLGIVTVILIFGSFIAEMISKLDNYLERQRQTNV